MTERPYPGRLVLLGHPVSHSLSPRMQNAALRSAGIALGYEALDVPPDELPRRLAELAAARAAGNVTIPHKFAMAGACARLTGRATRVGAVNTFWTEDGRFTGENTDVAGFDALAAAVLGKAPAGVRVALLGAGGGAAAVCAAVEEWRGCSVVVGARNRERGEALAARFSRVVRAVATLEGAARAADVVVNATPAGMRDDTAPVPIETLPRDAAVIDLVYRRGETAWVRAARAAGHRAADGLAMLVVQGARAFECWFGRAPDETVMRGALET